MIYGLSASTVVVASDHGEGGTWKGAVEALRFGLDVVVWRGEGEGPGNAPLEAAGARALKDIDDLESVLAAGGRENPEQFFITAVAGILDARSGELRLANAGHDAP